MKVLTFMFKFIHGLCLSWLLFKLSRKRENGRILFLFSLLLLFPSYLLLLIIMLPALPLHLNGVSGKKIISREKNSKDYTRVLVIYLWEKQEELNDTLRSVTPSLFFQTAFFCRRWSITQSILLPQFCLFC